MAIGYPIGPVRFGGCLNGKRPQKLVRESVPVTLNIPNRSCAFWGGRNGKCAQKEVRESVPVTLNSTSTLM